MTDVTCANDCLSGGGAGRVLVLGDLQHLLPGSIGAIQIAGRTQDAEAARPGQDASDSHRIADHRGWEALGYICAASQAKEGQDNIIATRRAKCPFCAHGILFVLYNVLMHNSQSRV